MRTLVDGREEMMFMASEAMMFIAYIHSSPQLSDLPTDLAHREARVTIVAPNCNSMRVLRSWSMFCTSRCRSTSAKDTEHFRLNKHPRMGDLVSAGCRAM